MWCVYLNKPADVLQFFIFQIVGILSLRLLSLEIGETQTGISPPVILAELVHVCLEELYQTNQIWFI